MQQHAGVEWEYEGAPDLANQPQESPSNLIPPPTEELQELYKLAKKGQIMGVREQIARLEQLDAKYQSFTTTLRQYAKGFNMRKLSEFLKPYLEVKA